jgi:hypothetical protein
MAAVKEEEESDENEFRPQRKCASRGRSQTKRFRCAFSRGRKDAREGPEGGKGGGDDRRIGIEILDAALREKDGCP